MPELTYEIWYLNHGKMLRAGLYEEVMFLPGHELFEKYFPDYYDRVFPPMAFIPGRPPVSNRADVPYGGEIDFLERVWHEWQEPRYGDRSMAVGDVVFLEDDGITLVCIVRYRGWFIDPQFEPPALYNPAVARVISALVYLSSA